MKLDFFRKIGFGLAPDENVPSDPIAWAVRQVETPAKLTWPGHIPSEQELLDHRAEFVYQDRRILREKFKNNRNAYDDAKTQLRYKTGERYFPSLETVIRHHAAVKGKAPVFERLWHFGAIILRFLKRICSIAGTPAVINVRPSVPICVAVLPIWLRK